MVINPNKTVRVNLPISQSWQRINVSSDKTFSAYIIEKKLLDKAIETKGTIDLSQSSITIQRDTLMFSQTIMGDGRYTLILRNNHSEAISLKVEVSILKSSP